MKLRLSPWEDVKVTKDKKRSYISVQCANGSWLGARGLMKHKGEQVCVDLTKFTKPFKVGGYMVTSHFTKSSTKEQCWADLILEFNGLILLAKQMTMNEPKPAIASFWCKAGRHRSCAMLISSLMYVAHVHDPTLSRHS